MMRTLPLAKISARFTRLVALPGTVTVVAKVVAWFHARGTGGTAGEVTDVTTHQEATTLAGALDVQATQPTLSASSGALMFTFQAGVAWSWARSGVGVSVTRHLENVTTGKLLGHLEVALLSAQVRADTLAVVATKKLLWAWELTRNRRRIQRTLYIDHMPTGRTSFFHLLTTRQTVAFALEALMHAAVTTR